MARDTAFIFGGAALALLTLGAGSCAQALPIVMPHMHAQHLPKPRGLKVKPAQSDARPATPPQQFHGLMDAAEADVRTRLGSPDVARAEGSGAMWTYSLPDCALFIFFRAPKGAAPDAPARVSGAASGPRVRGQRPLPVNACIAEAMTRQGGGAS